MVHLIKCPEILRFICKTGPRITVIHKANCGVSDARNTGIEHANGEYIAFVDSDEYVDKEYISHLYRLIQKFMADISVCGYTEVFESSLELKRLKCG